MTSYFDKRLSFASSIFACGADVGTFALAQAIPLSVENFGWQTSVKILGALMSTCILYSLLLTPPKSDPSSGETDIESKQEEKDEVDSNNGTSDLPPSKFKKTFKTLHKNGKIYVDLFSDIKFSIFVASNFFTCLGYSVPMIYTVVSIARISLV